MKTTKEHFELFKKECAKWAGRLGIMDWAIECSHGLPIEIPVEPDRLVFGHCVPDIKSKTVIVYLAEDWEDNIITPEIICNTAFHEMCELLLTEYRDLICSNVDWDLEETIRHSLIQRLESLRRNGWLKK